MENIASLVVASTFGLIAGIGHGVVSHFQDLPFSLSDQVFESLDRDRSN